MINFDLAIKFFLKKNMYFHKTVLNKTNRGKKIIKTLFSKIKKNTKKFIKNESLDNESKERNICDFIAGMTDRYAINLYNSIK
jgi:dGTPase